MSPRRLLVAAWVGGLVTLGGVVAMLVLVLTSPRFADDYDALPLWGAVIALILIIFAVGWYIGICRGKEGIRSFTVFLTILSILALTKIRHLDTGLMATSVLIGPCVMGWALGCLYILRREGAAGGFEGSG